MGSPQPKGNRECRRRAAASCPAAVAACRIHLPRPLAQLPVDVSVQLCYVLKWQQLRNPQQPKAPENFMCRSRGPRRAVFCCKVKEKESYSAVAMVSGGLVQIYRRLLLRKIALLYKTLYRLVHKTINKMRNEKLYIDKIINKIFIFL